jgi:hypothetical protein
MLQLLATSVDGKGLITPAPVERVSMLWLLTSSPWLVVCILAAGVIVACVAIVFITDYLRKSQQSEIDAALKQDMLNRGMSAVDIKTVLEACADGEATRMAFHQNNQGVRVGLGKFQVEVGGTNQHAPGAGESTTARR